MGNYSERGRSISIEKKHTLLSSSPHGRLQLQGIDQSVLYRLSARLAAQLEAVMMKGLKRMHVITNANIHLWLYVQPHPYNGHTLISLL